MLSIADLEKKLDAEKKRFAASKAAIGKMRLQIARQKCPYKKGAHIAIKEGGRLYSVKVVSIGFAIRYQEVWDPRPGFETTWMIEGDIAIKAEPYFGLPISTTGFSPVRNGIHINKRMSDKELLARMGQESETTGFQHRH